MHEFSLGAFLRACKVVDIETTGSRCDWPQEEMANPQAPPKGVLCGPAEGRAQSDTPSYEVTPKVNCYFNEVFLGAESP